MSSTDLRDEFFREAAWYQSLGRPRSGTPSVWYFAKGPPERATVAIANAGLAFAKRHGLDHHYRARLAGVPSKALTPERARSERRSVIFPLFEILNELIVASLLADSLGWRFHCHEPVGHRRNRGDWEFTLTYGKHVFVEVKSMSEPDYGENVFMKPRSAARIANVLRHAYRQLPHDERATVVALVADGGVLLDTFAGIPHGDLFQAFFGATVVRFGFDGTELSDPRLTSTFREAFVQRRKNRRLGAVLGLELRGIGSPAPNLYALHNPYAHASSALDVGATTALTRFFANSDGEARFTTGVGGSELWQRGCRARIDAAPAAELSVEDVR